MNFTKEKCVNFSVNLNPTVYDRHGGSMLLLAKSGCRRISKELFWIIFTAATRFLREPPGTEPHAGWYLSRHIFSDAA